MSEEALNHAVDVNRLPTLPAVAIEALRLMEGEPSSFESIAELLKNDQVLAGRVLHLANSAQLGARRQISSISQAVATLGFSAVRTIILSVTIIDTFSGQFDRQKEGLVKFWLHSIGVAATAEALAVRLGFPDPEVAYMAGLMHDLGKFVSYLQNPELFEQVCKELDLQGTYSTQGSLPLEIEKSVIGTSHIDIGRELAELWGLPDDLTRVLWLHHQPVFEAIIPENEYLPALVRFADLLCITHNIGSTYFFTTGAYCHEHFHFALENMLLHNHFSAESIEEMMAEVYRRVQDVGTVLGFWNEEVYHKLISSANQSLGEISMGSEIRNQQLEASNRVLAATCEMTRQLHPGLQLTKAAQVVVVAVRRAFGAKRCLCLIRDEAHQSFVGQLYDGDSFHEIEVPTHPAEMKRYSKRDAATDIEAEALQRLEQTTVEIARGAVLKSGVLKMVAGSKFLATFFVADGESSWRKEPVLGELVVDFAEADEFHAFGLERVTRNFEALGLSAGKAIERLLLEIDLLRQNEAMAEASRKMEESQRQLFHSHRLATVGRLAAGAAHEINNPLTIISLNTQILGRLIAKSKQSAEIVDRLRVVSEQEERISKIIQELMGFARPTQPKFCQSSVAHVVNKVLAVIGDRVSMANIEVDNQIVEKDLPKVMIDPLQIEQVFMNLLINANHAMPNGGSIQLRAKTLNGSVEISVTDTGEGISKKHLTQIFDPFFTTKKEGEGTGLGLAVCHSIVEHNGGSMTVRSEVGQGTTFTLTLPVDKGSRLRALKKDLDDKEKKAKAPVTPEQYRILVVDDERLLNDMLRDSLSASGYEVDGAYDGVEGIGMLRARKYHLVLLDIRMPRKDGLDVLKFIKEEFPDIQVVIITGHANKDDIQETVKYGAFACLKKPFRLEKVLDTVGKALKAKPRGAKTD